MFRRIRIQNTTKKIDKKNIFLKFTKIIAKVLKIRQINFSAICLHWTNLFTIIHLVSNNKG